MSTEATPSSDDTNAIDMLRSEIEAINVRRHASGRRLMQVRAGCEPPASVIEAMGLALSGGGIRSAAVSLGVLQALNHHDLLRMLDYLSTVSGGGYMGTSLTATMTMDRGRFVFGNQPRHGSRVPLASEISDSDEVGHIRNYSNYLFPAGMRDVMTGFAILVRGLVTNLGLVLPFLLFFAAVTIASNPYRSWLEITNVFGISLEKYIPVAHFGISLVVALVGLALFFAWAVARSFLSPRHLSEFRSWLPTIAAAYLIFLAAVFFCEAQSFVIDDMFKIYDARVAGQNIFLGLAASWVKALAAITAPIAAIVMFFRNQFGEILKATTASSKWSRQIAAVAIKASVWLAGLAVPLVIWVAYLYLSYWGIINDHPNAPAAAATCPRGSISATVKIDGQELNYRGEIARDGDTCAPSTPVPANANAAQPDTDTHTPQWLLSSALIFSKTAVGLANFLDLPPSWRLEYRPLISLYLFLALVLWFLGWQLMPNANSLHRLYRDRLSKAFLFNPRVLSQPRQIARNEPSLDQGRDFAPLDDMRVSDLSVELAPYQLINAALNIQGSDYANRRGRNADFFLFSPRYIGSNATGYAPMREFEVQAQDLDLATAMAISGAAASSNMGSSSIKPLTPTLALLNVRLGYWLKNPRFCSPSATRNVHSSRLRNWMARFYLWAEITGRLYENSDEIYLTDGGHIENLGVYELLRRRCKVIITVDAEADETMHFPSLITLQRYARIDLGIRIDLPWEPIATATLAEMQPDPENPRAPSCGPHVAVGTIDYGGGDIGYLIYIKSSLTGDENDYIRDYARRYSSFPHEITLDQLFSEEQFEAYRALGFHMAHGFLSAHDRICVNEVSASGDTRIKMLKLNDASNPILAEVHRRLFPSNHVSGRTPD